MQSRRLFLNPYLMGFIISDNLEVNIQRLQHKVHGEFLLVEISILISMRKIN